MYNLKRRLKLLYNVSHFHKDEGWSILDIRNRILASRCKMPDYGKYWKEQESMESI